MIMSRGCTRKERPRYKYVLALFPLLLGDDFGHYLIGVVFMCAHMVLQQILRRGRGEEAEEMFRRLASKSMASIAESGENCASTMSRCANLSLFHCPRKNISLGPSNALFW
jgi:hypothetical protein